MTLLTYAQNYFDLTLIRKAEVVDTYDANYQAGLTVTRNNE